MTANPDAGKNNAYYQKVLSDDHRNKGKTLQVVMKCQNSCCQHGNSQTHKNILSIVFIYKACTLFQKELTADDQCKADADDRYEIISVDDLQAFFLPCSFSNAL